MRLSSSIPQHATVSGELFCEVLMRLLMRRRLLGGSTAILMISANCAAALRSHRSVHNGLNCKHNSAQHITRRVPRTSQSL